MGEAWIMAESAVGVPWHFWAVAVALRGKYKDAADP